MNAFDKASLKSLQSHHELARIDELILQNRLLKRDLEQKAVTIDHLQREYDKIFLESDLRLKQQSSKARRKSEDIQERSYLHMDELSQLEAHWQAKYNALAVQYRTLKLERRADNIPGFEERYQNASTESQLSRFETRISDLETDLRGKTERLLQVEADFLDKERIEAMQKSQIERLSEEVTRLKHDKECYESLLYEKSLDGTFLVDYQVRKEKSLADELTLDASTTAAAQIAQLEDENKSLLLYIRTILAKLMECDDTILQRVLHK